MIFNGGNIKGGTIFEVCLALATQVIYPPFLFYQQERKIFLQIATGDRTLVCAVRGHRVMKVQLLEIVTQNRASKV